MSEHDWSLTVSDNKAEAHTCAKCGLLRLTTLSGEFYFTQVNPQFAQCPAPYREPAAPKPEPSSTPIDTLFEEGLSVRGYNCLFNNRLETIEQVCQRSARELLEFKNLGQRTLNEIRQLLGNRGLALRGESVTARSVAR